MNKRVLSIAMTVVAAFAFNSVLKVTADETQQQIEDLRKEVEELKEGQSDIQKGLEEIKKLVSSRGGRPAAPSSATIDIAGKPVKGDKNAKLTMVEFSEYQCPFCARHVKQTQPKIKEEYIDTGKVKLVFMDFPLGFHKFAPKAAEATHCAGDQGKYWEMHDVLFDNSKALAEENLIQYATDLGLDVSKFEDCLKSGKFAEQIKEDMKVASSAGITGTPGFWIGVTDPNSTKLKATEFLRGAQPYEKFKEAFDELLK